MSIGKAQEGGAGLFSSQSGNDIVVGIRATSRMSKRHLTEKVAPSMSEGPVGLPDDEINLIILYEQFRRPLHSYAYRLLGNQEDADDITQEVFVRACVSWDGLYERQQLSAWLYRIATNLCIDLLRRRKRVFWRSLTKPAQGELVSEEDNIVWLADPGGIPQVAEREVIRQALEQIPTEYAVALVLSAAQGLSYHEVAAVVGISPNAAATRISRAKKLFAEKYQRLCRDSDAVSMSKPERRRVDE
jgi:RNA polymerase sigma-70 factor (ECF subfamily)